MNDLLFISCFLCMDAAGRQGITAQKRSKCRNPTPKH